MQRLLSVVGSIIWKITQDLIRSMTKYQFFMQQTGMEGRIQLRQHANSSQLSSKKANTLKDRSINQQYRRCSRDSMNLSEKKCIEHHRFVRNVECHSYSKKNQYQDVQQLQLQSERTKLSQRMSANANLMFPIMPTNLNWSYYLEIIQKKTKRIRVELETLEDTF